MVCLHSQIQKDITQLLPTSKCSLCPKCHSCSTSIRVTIIQPKHKKQWLKFRNSRSAFQAKCLHGREENQQIWGWWEIFFPSFALELPCFPQCRVWSKCGGSRSWVSVQYCWKSEPYVKELLLFIPLYFLKLTQKCWMFSSCGE